MSSHCYILPLPIELLNLVYKYIPDMKDKLNLAKSHCVLGKAFAFHAGNTFKAIKIKDRPIGEWSEILPMCGSSIKSINIRGDRNNVIMVKLASMHCPNLEKIHLYVNSSSWTQIKSLLVSLQNVSHIELWSFDPQNVSVVDTLLQMPKLKHLTLHWYDNPDLERIGELANLTKLNLSSHGERIDIFKVCSPLKNIERLEISSAFIRLPKNHGELWPKIEELQVSHGIFHTPLPYLPTLKHLTIEINNSKNSLSDVFGESVFSYGKTLESLSYYPRFSLQDNEIGILKQLKALKKLEVDTDNLWINDISQLKNLV